MGIYNSVCDFNKYKTFYAVAETKSFSKASELLLISQPAISYAIKELEDNLDTKLFIRERSGVILTEDGEKLMHYLQKAFRNIVKAERVITKKEDVMGVVKIGIYTHISKFMLPKIIKEFINLHPDVKFSIFQSSNNDMTEQLRRRDMDFVIMQYPVFLSDSNYTEEIICEFDTCFYGNKEMYERFKNPNEDDIYPLVLPFSGYADIDSLEEKLKSNNIKFTSSIRSYSSETTIELVKEGLGIGWGLKRLIKNELKRGELYEIPVDFDSPKTVYSIIYDEKFLNDTTRSFLEFFKDNLNKMV